jgi:hypothetical protein
MWSPRSEGLEGSRLESRKMHIMLRPTLAGEQFACVDLSFDST